MAIKNKTEDYYVQHDKKELSHDASVRQSKSHRYLIPESSVDKYCSQMSSALLAFTQSNRYWLTLVSVPLEITPAAS